VGDKTTQNTTLLLLKILSKFVFACYVRLLTCSRSKNERQTYSYTSWRKNN